MNHIIREINGVKYSFRNEEVFLSLLNDVVMIPFGDAVKITLLKIDKEIIVPSCTLQSLVKMPEEELLTIISKAGISMFLLSQPTSKTYPVPTKKSIWRRLITFIKS